MMKNKIAVIILSILFILAANRYFSYLSKEYVVYIHDAAMLSEISDGIFCFGNTVADGIIMLEDLLLDITKKEKRTIYLFDVDFIKNNSFMSQEDIKKTLLSYDISEAEMPVLMKLRNGKPDCFLNIKDYYKVIEDDMREYVKYFLNYREYPLKHIPHNTVMIIIFILSISLFACAYKIKTQELLFALSMCCVCLILIIPSWLSSAVRYIDYYRLSGNPRITTLMLLTVILNIVSLILFSLKQKRRVSQ